MTILFEKKQETHQENLPEFQGDTPITEVLPDFNENNRMEENPIDKNFFQVFKESFNQESEPEKKIQLTIDFMRNVLSTHRGTNLKDFWDAKHLCAPVFKEKMNPVIKNQLWSEYSSLSSEVQRLKEIMDEQAAFSIEQIELAIEALEADLAHYDKLIEQIPHLEFPKNSTSFIKKQDVYNQLQRELHLLKILGSRLDSLRHEVLKTEMRNSSKNRILKRLSGLGDHIFPKRKELIKQVSNQFLEDVEVFVKYRFPTLSNPDEEEQQVPNYMLREEIIACQVLAKLLTLNSQSFNKTRKLLSQCWDFIKEKEKERKKEFTEKSKDQKENFSLILKKIEAYASFCQLEENLVKDKIMQGATLILDEMKTLSISWEGINTLKEKIQSIRKEALDKIVDEDAKKIKTAQKKNNDIKQKLTLAIEKGEETDLPTLMKIEEELLNEWKSLESSLIDQHILERSFSDLRGLILDKKVENTFDIKKLEEILEERENLFLEIKAQAEKYRKELGSSRLDIEKAMTYRELSEAAKIHLEWEGDAIVILEEKMREEG